MRTEKEIIFRIKFLEKQLKKYYSIMDKKYKVRNEREMEKFEEAEEMYYESLVEINTLKWVLGVQ